MEQANKKNDLAANGIHNFGNPSKLAENSKIGKNDVIGLDIKDKPCYLDSLDSIHARYADMGNFDQKTFKAPRYVKSETVFRPSDKDSAPYTFVAQRIGKPNFLQRSDLLSVVCQTLEDQRKELIKEARRFWINNHETMLQIEFFDNTGLIYNRVGFTRRTFSPEGKPVGVKVWKKKNCDFWDE
jgi:hypothetical protein